MNSSEFKASLQMTFEVLGTTELNEDQLLVIKTNLNSVFDENYLEISPFCNQLKGYFDLFEPTVLTLEVGKKIQNKLNKILDVKSQIQPTNQQQTYRC